MTDPRPDMITAASSFYANGWMPANTGDLSVRLSDGTIWITTHGSAKGHLTEKSFIRIRLTGEVAERFHSTDKSSPEIVIHMTIYQLFLKAKACYHIHCVPANIVSNLTEKDTILLPPLEILKGFNIWEATPHIWLPIFENHSNVSQISHEIEDRFSKHPPEIPVFLIRNHGIFVWADHPDTARNDMERMNYILQYMVTAHMLGLSSSKRS